MAEFPHNPLESSSFNLRSALEFCPAVFVVWSVCFRPYAHSWGFPRERVHNRILVWIFQSFVCKRKFVQQIQMCCKTNENAYKMTAVIFQSFSRLFKYMYIFVAKLLSKIVVGSRLPPTGGFPFLTTLTLQVAVWPEPDAFL